MPYGIGGSTDLTARSVAIELEQIWGQPVVVENRPGAGYMIGTTAMTQADANRLTVLINTAAPAFLAISFQSRCSGPRTWPPR